MTAILALLILTAAANAADAKQNTADCPMHAQHMAAQSKPQPADHDFAAMQKRGDKAMGFDQEKTTHHFVLSPDGGRIEVQANSADDHTDIENVRRHLQHIANAFADGDFAIPREVHDQVPTGVQQMQQMKDRIRYRYQELAQGGAVVISSSDSAAIAAIHNFLHFQITEHHTGDDLKH